MTHDPTDADQPSDSVADFAADLRMLRMEHGNPTLATLASLTGISKSVISDAFAGRKLPTENTTGLLAEALGGDRSVWLNRRRNLMPRTVVASAAPAERHPRRTVPVWGTVLIALSSAIAAALATSAIWSTVILPPALAAATPTPTDSYLAYADGVDPMQTVCREDAVIAASEQRQDGQFQVQMLYSKKCMAVWGRITRYDDESAGNSLTMLIYPAVDPESPRNQERSAFDVQSIYTTLMIEPDVDARVCGIATVTRDGHDPIQLGPPMCV